MNMVCPLDLDQASYRRKAEVLRSSGLSVEQV